MLDGIAVSEACVVVKSYLDRMSRILQGYLWISGQKEYIHWEVTCRSLGRREYTEPSIGRLFEQYLGRGSTQSRLLEGYLKISG